MADVKNNIGRNIRTLRRKMKISQEKASEIAGFSSTYWGQLERGERNPTLQTLQKIALALDSSVHFLAHDIQDDTDIKRNELINTINNKLDKADIDFFHLIITSYLNLKK